MMNLRSLIAGLAIVCLSVCVSVAVARGPNKGAGQQRGGNNGMPPMAGAANANGQAGNAMGGNMMGQQNMPTVEQLAQALLAKFDADGSNALDQAELQAALEGLRQMMMMQKQAAANGQQQMGGMMQQNQNGMPPAGRGPGGQRGPGGRGGR